MCKMTARIGPNPGFPPRSPSDRAGSGFFSRDEILELCRIHQGSASCNQLSSCHPLRYRNLGWATQSCCGRSTTALLTPTEAAVKMTVLCGRCPGGSTHAGVTERQLLLSPSLSGSFCCPSSATSTATSRAT